MRYVTDGFDYAQEPSLHSGGGKKLFFPVVDGIEKLSKPYLG